MSQLKAHAQVECEGERRKRARVEQKGVKLSANDIVLRMYHTEGSVGGAAWNSAVARNAASLDKFIQGLGNSPLFSDSLNLACKRHAAIAQRLKEVQNRAV